jgi:hypothetical protein
MFRCYRIAIRDSLTVKKLTVTLTALSVYVVEPEITNYFWFCNMDMGVCVL